MTSSPPAAEVSAQGHVLERGKYWSTVAPGYDAVFDNREGRLYVDLEAELMREFLQPKPGMRILDVCAGTGRNTMPLAMAGADMVDLDAGVGMIAVARQKLRDAGLNRVQFVNSDVCKLPFPDNTFDAATGTRFMYMMSPEQKRQVIAELARVVKPGCPIALQFNGGFWGLKHELSNLMHGRPFRMRSRYLWPGDAAQLFGNLELRHVVGVKIPLLGAVGKVIGEGAARRFNRLARLPGFRFLAAYLVVHAVKPRG